MQRSQVFGAATATPTLATHGLQECSSHSFTRLSDDSEVHLVFVTRGCHTWCFPALQELQVLEDVWMCRVFSHLLPHKRSCCRSTMTEVRQFYAGKNIFITGATGFFGKVLIDKLLRCCPKVDKIYCLVRPKKGRDPSERLSHMFTDKVEQTFSRVPKLSASDHVSGLDDNFCVLVTAL